MFLYFIQFFYLILIVGLRDTNFIQTSMEFCLRNKSVQTFFYVYSFFLNLTIHTVGLMNLRPNGPMLSIYELKPLTNRERYK